MRIIKYQMKINEKEQITLVKEASHNFPLEYDIKNPTGAAQVLNQLYGLKDMAEEYFYMLALGRRKILGVFEHAQDFPSPQCKHIEIFFCHILQTIQLIQHLCCTCRIFDIILQREVMGCFLYQGNLFFFIDLHLIFNDPHINLLNTKRSRRFCLLPSVFTGILSLPYICVFQFSTFLLGSCPLFFLQNRPRVASMCEIP